MKKLVPLFAVCLAVLCFFSSCGMYDNHQVEAKYKLQGYIIKASGIMVDRCAMYLYHNGQYEIELVNSGTWKRSEDDPNKIILTASDSEIFSTMELQFFPITGELEVIDYDSDNPDFEINGSFYYSYALKP